jgi:hypothetical protein
MNSADWEDPGEFVRSAAGEAAQVREWLGDFGPALPDGAEAVLGHISMDLSGETDRN